MKQFTRFVLAVLLLPVCYGVLRSLWTVLYRFHDVPEGSFYFAIGCVAYLTFQWVFFKPMRTYVFGHELTHALAAWMTGGKVHQFKVSKKGGSVVVSKPNIFVALAPYIVPLYSLILMGAFLSANMLYNIMTYWNYFLAVLGGSLAFHASLTIFALQQNQPDLKTGGKFLSGVLIVLGNAFALVFLLGVIFPKTVSWKTFLEGARSHTVLLCRLIGVQGSAAWEYGRQNVHGYYQR